MENVEDVIVSSGLNTRPNWHNFSDTDVKAAATTREIASKGPSAKEACAARQAAPGRQP
jgi:hypothetical protein